MTFLTPLIGGLAAAVAIPSLLILYFLKLRRRDVEISTTLLWKKAIQDLQANAPFQKLRRNLLLFLQLIILAAILFGLAQPQFKGAGTVGQRIVILIDRSASMEATDGADSTPGKPVTRIEQARKEASAIIDAMREPGILQRGSADEAMIIAFDKIAMVVQHFTTDKRLLKQALEGIQPVDGPTSIGEAMRLAKAHAPKRIFTDADGSQRTIDGLSGGTPLTIHLFSDGRLPDAGEASIATEDNLFYHPSGAANSGNIGLVGLRADRKFDEPQKLSIFVGLLNTFKEQRTVDVELIIEGVGARIKTANIPGATETTEAVAGGEAVRKFRPGTGGVLFELERMEGATAQVRLSPPTSAGAAAELDALPIDNMGWVVVPPAKRLAVAVVTKGNLFVSTALEGLPLARLDRLTPGEFETALKDGKTGEYDVVILDGYLPPYTPPPAEPGKPARAEIGLPPGRYLILNAAPGPVLTQTGRAEGASTIIDWKRDHPTLRSSMLDNLLITGMPIVTVNTGAEALGRSEILATSDRGPAIIELESGDARAVVVPFDIVASSWPFDVSFVLFMASSVGYLGNTGSALDVNASSVQPGSTLVARLPTGAADVRLTLPGGIGGEHTLQPAPDGTVSYGPVERAGVYRLNWKGRAGPSDLSEGGRAERAIAANLLDSAESDIAVPEELALASRVVGADQTTQAKVENKLWPWLLLAALVVMMLEWWVYNRKVYL